MEEYPTPPIPTTYPVPQSSPDALLSQIRSTPWVDPATGVTASYDAGKAQAAHILASMHVDRTGWTRKQWIDDAKKLFYDPDGSVLDFVNGHITALFAELDDLQSGRRRKA